MATIDNKELIKELIRKDGYFEDDPRIYSIIEYINAWGNIVYGVVSTMEMNNPIVRMRYLVATDFVQKPKLIWHCDMPDLNAETKQAWGIK